MGRAPCCEKMGLKKGPWTDEEDQILIKYINQNGHSNWRALPKRAGLLRCGKSCRLRWVNYLRPDIKRGNFTAEEEEIIIKLHAELGNKWCVIASKLPGRTDNEIKNVWHTHLKKKKMMKSETKTQSTDSSESDLKAEKHSAENQDPCSPVNSSSEISSVTSASASASAAVSGGSGEFDFNMLTDSLDSLTEMGESFWSEVFSESDWSASSSDISAAGNGDSDQLQFAESFASDLNTGICDDFWGNLFNRAQDLTESFDFFVN
ncbi:hypothetical protein ABFS82_14G204600 [Erythranthe guttata]|uniref:Uncharacterized protein n=1 Tax=Erythranthe guttata TaxID=4155 RepID=A0A022PR10_ERYGU|nr:PREDICTED: myb-related protein Myb4-like [Erythranthe guttata]EYU17914.1 hypothetical protein MIMGU_mgv1a012084mg [Erythranthe guttata]|eukprot:XP_012828913.1 PREDICTED: myb-related protein Myb4-like [Erythranthe guttata]